MTAYYKATRPDGRDFYSGTIDYAAALLSGEIIRHSERPTKSDASTYLSVSISPTDCTGFSWPCRLFRVKPVGQASKVDDLPNKRAVSALLVTEELPAWQAFGPNGEAVVAIIERAGRLTRDETQRLAAARDAARDAAWTAARAAAWDAARDAAWTAAWAAAWDAARAELVRDLITPEQYATLMAPWRSVVPT